MRFRHRIQAFDASCVGIAPEFPDREIRAFWRELARPVTVFDEHSPTDLSSGRNRRIL
jgi:hypothetical protein